MTLSISNLDGSSVAAPLNVEVGEAVRRAREAMGYSVDALAETCGLTEAEISRIELGAEVEPSRLRRIASALQVDPSVFLGS
jgi:transcriptional regulator with XRE-family HTH domain